jgi:hypothetical protein
VCNPPIRRLLIALLFPLLLIAQQGAFVHSLEHLPGSASTSKSWQDNRGAPADQYCEKCFTFAHIGAAADCLPAIIGEFAGAFEAIAFRLTIAPFPQARIPRSRGPPSLL